MNKYIFKLFIVLTFICTMTTMSAQRFTFDNPSGKTGITLVKETKGNVVINCSLQEFELEPLTYKGEDMVEINLSGIFIPNDMGMPNLPRFSRFIAIPQGAEVSVHVKKMDSEIIQNVNIAPALELQIENAEPIKEYVKNEKIYNTNKAYPASNIEVSPKMSIRGVDVVIVGITPFQYNPVTKELTVYNNIQLELEFVGGRGYIGDDRYRSRWFDPILANAVLNYESLPKIDYEKRTQELRNRNAEGCEFLIVIPNDEAWRPYAEQLRQYRIKQGINTKIMSLAEMECTTTSQMKTFFHNAYNTWEIPPVAVLLMADHGTNMANRIPAETTNHPSSGSCITDNQYADVTGDKLPEMCFARMTAENVNHLQTMVSKVLEYEYEAPCMEEYYYQNPITALGWQTERWFQICSEVIGGYLSTHGRTPVRINEIYEGTPGAIWSSAQNTIAVVNYFGVNGLGYLPASPSLLGGWTGGTAAKIITAVNNGAFILQHRDHGFEQGWGEPSFKSTHINQLTNVGKLTYVFSINCLTGKFNHTGSCFAENFHRHTSNGQNAGAVGILCPTEISYSFVNDTYIWGAYDLFQPDFMPDYGPYATNSGNWMPAFGNVAGKFFLAQSNWPYNTEDKLITYQMFTHHSDPFLRLYTEVPQNLSVTHQSTILAGSSSLAITCEEGALISLTIGDEILAVADATGSVQNIIIPPLIPTTEILVTCTKQNHLRYESTITVVPSAGAYVIGFEWDIIDENGNQIIEYAENGVINMTVKNVGIETANNVVMNISTDDPYITINKSSENFGNIVPDATALKNNAFSFTVAQDIPNNHPVLIKMESTDGTDVWISYMSFRIYSPLPEFVGNGAFGDIVPGNTLNVVASFKNKGGAPIYNATGTLSSTNEYITINNPNFNYGNIDANGTVDGVYSVTISNEAPEHGSFDFQVDMVADYNISSEGEFSIKNACNLVFVLNDSYGDGWNGAKLRVTFSDGTPQVEYTCTGESSTFIKEVNTGTTVTLTWLSGSWDYECSFTVSYEGGDQIFAASNPNSGVLHTFVCNCNGGAYICESVNEVVAAVDGNTVILTWEEIQNVTSYIVKRNGVVLETCNNNIFTDSAVVPGDYNYCVFAVYNDGCIALPTCTDAVVSLCAHLQELTATVIDSTNIELTWNAVEESQGYNIYFEGDLIGTTTSTSFMIENLDWETEYCYAVTSMCEFGESNKIYACATTPYEPCYIPIGLVTTTAEEMSVLITWNATTSAISYELYRDDLLIYEGMRRSYTDKDLEIGTYCYTVRAKCAVDMSELSEESCADVVGIDEWTNDFKVYPNPANTNVTIEGNNIESIVVYNTLGQIVFKQNVVDEKILHIKTENLPDGFYLFRITSCEGQAVIKQISIVH